MLHNSTLAIDHKGSPIRSAIRDLYARRGIEPSTSSFRCPALSACSQGAQRRARPFATGNWAYVGVEYGNAPVEGEPVRILFVAMDRGGFLAGSQESFAETQREFRMGAELRWNPHMGGVSTIMEHLVDHSDRHVYARQFALTNAVKCVEVTGKAKTACSKTMRQSCAHHLAAEIEVLQPGIIVTQGEHPASTVIRLLDLRDAQTFGDGRSFRASVRLFGNDGRLVLTTPHPARLRGLKWKVGKLPGYLAEGIEAVRAHIRDGL